MESSNRSKKLRIKWFSLVRIAGLFLVLGYHYFQNTYPGGFVGVDVFFVFSGFLITALMIDEFSNSGRFKLVAFYKRRFYRIVPPLILSVLIVMPFTYLVGPDFTTNIGKQIAAAFGFVTNYFEIATGGSYETNFIPHLFVHTWSLAVEMHFYITWGLLVYLFSRVIRILPGGRRNQLLSFRRLLFIIAVIFAGTSLAAMRIGSTGLKDYSPVYFSSLTHCFPFFIGAALSTMTGIATLPRGFARTIEKWTAGRAILVMVVSFVGLVVITLTLDFKAHFTYPYGMLLSVLLGASMIIAARILHEKTPWTAEPWLITFIADCSYSVYLYHWPLYVIFSHRMPNIWAAVWTTVFSFAFAAFSYYLVEPILAGRRGHLLGYRISGRSVTTPLMALLVGLFVLTGFTASHAPRMSTLERNLWIGGIYQDVDGIKQTNNEVLAEVHPVKNNKAPNTAPPKKDPNNYLGKNSHSSAAKYKIPRGASIIGDSVTLGTRHYLQPNVAESEVDAEGDRTLDKAYKVMMGQQKNNQLREFVVICVGTNALNDYEEQAKKIIQDIAPGHKLVFMTPYDAQATASWNSTKLGEFERTLPAKYNWITLADWGKTAPQHPDVFKGTDGVHFAGRPAGDHLYAQVVNAGLMAAAKKPAKPK